ncbi:hypothetical protein ACH5RR_033933 [Cinchona calisaya]|uniref:Uncharacterized protein n=1 Tax=Cinchona calisaya TaxID=153742 RepID=A0ABD2YE09_9GENT
MVLDIYRTRKPIAVQKSLKRSDVEGLHLELVVEYFAWQDWEIPLHINEPIYHYEVLQFYANLRSTNKKDFVSTVNHVELELDKYIINDIINCQVRVDENHEITDDFFSYDKWPTKKHGKKTIPLIGDATENSSYNFYDKAQMSHMKLKFHDNRWMCKDEYLELVPPTQDACRPRKGHVSSSRNSNPHGKGPASMQSNLGSSCQPTPIIDEDLQSRMLNLLQDMSGRFDMVCIESRAKLRNKLGDLRKQLDRVQYGLSLVVEDSQKAQFHGYGSIIRKQTLGTR